MKTLPILASSLALAALLLPAHAQTPAATPPRPAQRAAQTPAQTPAQRAANYKGPKVVPDSKALGQKMVQKSKPADGIIQRSPVKK